MSNEFTEEELMTIKSLSNGKKILEIVEEAKECYRGFEPLGEAKEYIDDCYNSGYNEGFYSGIIFIIKAIFKEEDKMITDEQNPIEDLINLHASLKIINALFRSNKMRFIAELECDEKTKTCDYLVYAYKGMFNDKKFLYKQYTNTYENMSIYLDAVINSLNL